MGKIKQIYMEIQEKLGEDIEVTKEIFAIAFFINTCSYAFTFQVDP